jgi:predicted transposase/invertase (TIGR01784 family)
LVNPFNPKDFKEDKLSIVDIRARNEDGEWFIIEVQIIMTDYYPQRILYYWARTYQNQLKAAVHYDQLKKVTIISISKDELPIKTKNYVSNFKVVSLEDRQTVFCDDLAIYTIELAKFEAKEEDIKKTIEKWTYFLKNGENLDDENLPKFLEEEEMSLAVNELKKLSMDEKEREIYEARRMSMIDTLTREAYSYRKGIKEGEKLGVEKGKIETLLEIKFGEKSLYLMNQIQTISEIEKLTQIQKAIKQATDIRELELMLNDSKKN